MHAVIRTYAGSGASELFDLLQQRKSDVEGLMRPIEGFVTYLLVRTADGGTSVTICQDKAGTDESLRRAREWVATNASGIGAGEPTVSEGPVILHSQQSDMSAAISSPMPTAS